MKSIPFLFLECIHTLEDCVGETQERIKLEMYHLAKLVQFSGTFNFLDSSSLKHRYHQSSDNNSFNYITPGESKDSFYYEPYISELPGEIKEICR